MQKTKKKHARSVTKARRVRRWLAVGGILPGLLLVALTGLVLHSRAAGIRETRPASGAVITGSYLYYVLKGPDGFTIARAREGTNHQPLEAPHSLVAFSDAFGQTTADAVLSLQLSPDGRYLAIDGTRSDCELVWILDTRALTLSREPATASGTFLHWLPGASAAFLFRPMFPLGPDASPVNGIWQPGLWKVDAATGQHTNLDIHMASAFLVDAIVSPDEKRIIYSTTTGIGEGSTIWSIDSDGRGQTRLLQLTDLPQSIAGMFSWSPNGQMLAYERLADSPTPFLPASVWTMNSDGSHQHYLAEGDGGHGFALSWSPTGKAIAFVSRTNLTADLANLRAQSLESAVEIVDVNSGKVNSLAGPVQTGMQINTNPVWSADGSHITFLAFNPLNPEFGGSPRYWSVGAGDAQITPDAVLLTTPLMHVVAFQ